MVSVYVAVCVCGGGSVRGHSFSLVFQFAMMLALPTCCCTLRVDAGNRLSLCEGEVDFFCQVPNLFTY